MVLVIPAIASDTFASAVVAAFRPFAAVCAVTIAEITSATFTLLLNKES